MLFYLLQWKKIATNPATRKVTSTIGTSTATTLKPASSKFIEKISIIIHYSEDYVQPMFVGNVKRNMKDVAPGG